MLLDLVGLSGGLVVDGGILRHHYALVAAIGQIIQHFVHLIDQRRIPSQVLHLLVRDDEAADGLGQVDEKGRVAHVVFRDLSLIVSEFSEVLSALRSENRQANDRVADHDSTVLNQHGVVDAHQEALLEHETDVRVQLIKAAIDVLSLPLMTIVEGDLLRVRQEVTMERPVLTLKSLLLSCKAAKCRGDQTNDVA